MRARVEARDIERRHAHVYGQGAKTWCWSVAFRRRIDRQSSRCHLVSVLQWRIFTVTRDGSAPAQPRTHAQAHAGARISDIRADRYELQYTHRSIAVRSMWPHRPV